MSMPQTTTPASDLPYGSNPARPRGRFLFWVALYGIWFCFLVVMAILVWNRA